MLSFGFIYAILFLFSINKYISGIVVPKFLVRLDIDVDITFIHSFVHSLIVPFESALQRS